jgi:hypothetical protein
MSEVNRGMGNHRLVGSHRQRQKLLLELGVIVADSEVSG